MSCIAHLIDPAGMINIQMRQRTVIQVIRTESIQSQLIDDSFAIRQ